MNGCVGGADFAPEFSETGGGDTGREKLNEGPFQPLFTTLVSGSPSPALLNARDRWRTKAMFDDGPARRQWSGRDFAGDCDRPWHLAYHKSPRLPLEGK